MQDVPSAPGSNKINPLIDVGLGLITLMTSLQDVMFTCLLRYDVILMW